MKNIVIAICLLLSASSVAQAQFVSLQGQRAEPTISVTGEAELRVVPDQVLISMTVETRGEDLIKTKKRNDAIVQSVLTYVTQEAKVAQNHVQTDYVTVTPDYQNCNRYSSSSEWQSDCDPLEIVYFQTRKGLQIRLNDLNRYEEIITKSLELGVTTINNIQFITTELRKHKDKAREMAARAAQEKAEAVAGTLKMKVLKPVSIHLDRSDWHYWRGHGRGHNPMLQNSIQSVPSSAEGASEGATLALGQITITAKVTAVFEMQ